NQLSTSPYIPLAARVKQFLEKTPDRFKPKLVSIKPLPPARTIPTTKSKPFKLETDARGEKYKQNLHQELTKMKRRDKENHIFHAKPAPKFPTTQVKKPSKPPTVPVSFVFQTDTRMKERKAFDQQRKLRDQMKNLHREKKRDVRH
ncbi:8291_t:CDS:2, partial [Racocetra fulgida]